MDIKTLAPGFSVTPQIAPEDMAAIKAAGFRAVICNRPDGEGADQQGFQAIEAAAHKAGLQAAYIPVIPGMMTDQDVTALAAALDALPHPVLAYCRSGARSAALWAQLENTPALRTDRPDEAQPSPTRIDRLDGAA